MTEHFHCLFFWTHLLFFADLDVFFAQFFNIVFQIVRHFQSEGKFSGRGKKWKKWRYLTIENHVRYKHCVDSDIKVQISKALSRYKKITFRMETRCSLTLVLLPRLSPIGKIVHLIGDNFKPFFSSPDPKGHVSYCHHWASVVCRPSSVR